MSISKTHTTILLGAVLLVMGLWFGFSTKEEKPETIKIGVVASLTGPGAYYGESIQNGVTLAVEEINAAGGVDGIPIEVIVEDDATNPQKTVSATEKLTNLDNVLAIVGIQWDFLANAAVPVAERAGVAAISTAAQYDSLLSEKKSPNFFTTYPSVEAHDESIKVFFEREEIRTVAIIAAQNDWGTAHVNAYTKAAEASGVSVVKVFRVTQVDHNDFRTQMAQLKELSPDAVILALNDGDNLSYIKWHRDFGVEAAVLGNMNFAHPFQNGEIGYAAGEGMYFMDFTDPTSGFVEKYTARFGTPPHIAADTSYDAIYVIKEAIEKEEATKEGILRGLKRVDGYRGASGLIDFSENNYPKNKSTILYKISASDAIPLSQ